MGVVSRSLVEHGDRALQSVDTLANEASKVARTLQGPDGAVQRITASVDRATTSVEAVAAGVELETLPRGGDERGHGFSSIR